MQPSVLLITDVCSFYKWHEIKIIWKLIKNLFRIKWVVWENNSCCPFSSEYQLSSRQRNSVACCPRHKYFFSGPPQWTEAEDFCSGALGPTQPPTVGTWDFNRGWMRPGRAANHSPPSCAEVKKESELYLLSPKAPLWSVTGPLYLHNEWIASSLRDSERVCPPLACKCLWPVGFILSYNTAGWRPLYFNCMLTSLVIAICGPRPVALTGQLLVHIFFLYIKNLRPKLKWCNSWPCSWAFVK
jgi:hypothetical protein